MKYFKNFLICTFVVIICIILFRVGFPITFGKFLNWGEEGLINFFNFLDKLRSLVLKNCISLKRHVFSTNMPYWETKITQLLPVLAFITVFLLQIYLIFKQMIENSKISYLTKII